MRNRIIQCSDLEHVFTEEQLEQSIEKELLVEQIEPGQVLIKQDDIVKYLYYVIEGTLLETTKKEGEAHLQGQAI